MLMECLNLEISQMEMLCLFFRTSVYKEFRDSMNITSDISGLEVIMKKDVFLADELVVTRNQSRGRCSCFPYQY